MRRENIAYYPQSIVIIVFQIKKIEGGWSPDSKMVFSHIFISNSKFTKTKGGLFPDTDMTLRPYFILTPNITSVSLSVVAHFVK